ncbi:MAG: hypothetical protein CVV49_02580 [Spirochaetae bacterium HGW-Spirochaetae-5]|nr:MAG: hypothetical protein CVV49_02580 [Spirochaetae bacterium HGW-Spirochaetae-5]
MIIGIDTYFLSMKNNTGIGTFVLNTILGISKIDHVNEYILFTPAIVHHQFAEEILKNKNFKIVIVKSLFPSRRLWLQSLNLRKVILDNNTDVFWGGGEYIPVLLPARVKTCATIHDVVFKVLPKTAAFTDKIFYNFLLPFSLHKTDSLLTISNVSKKEIVKYLKIEPEKIKVIYDGIDLKKFIPDEKQIKEKFILFVGTLQPRKNMISLVEAFILLADKIDHDLVVVGATGWKSSDLSEKILSLPDSLSKRIHFKGYVSDEELVELYQTADLFVAPSLHEGFGLIIAEAVACGTPVLTTRRGAIPEVFEDIPEYADPLSPVDISDKIISILSDPVKMRQMSVKGLDFIRKYDINNVSRQYIDFFNTL